MKYTRKTIYFKTENKDLFDYLEKQGKQASEYVCKLIRADMERENKDSEELTINELKALREEINALRMDFKNIKIEVKEDELPLEEPSISSEIELDDSFGGILDI